MAVKSVVAASLVVEAEVVVSISVEGKNKMVWKLKYLKLEF